MAIIFFAFGTRVTLRIIGQKIDVSKTTTFSPEYEIISGEYAGVKTVSWIGTSLGTHKKGSEVSGLYLRAFDQAESVVSLVFTAFFGAALILGGIAFHITG